MNKHESRSAPLCSAIAVVAITTMMSAFVVWAYSDIAIPEQGIVAAINSTLDPGLGRSLQCVRGEAMAIDERINP